MSLQPPKSCTNTCTKLDSLFDLLFDIQSVHTSAISAHFQSAKTSTGQYSTYAIRNKPRHCY